MVEQRAQDDLRHLVAARRELVEHQVLARHGRLVAVRLLLGCRRASARRGRGTRCGASRGPREPLPRLRCAAGAPASRLILSADAMCRESRPQIALNNSNGWRHCSQYITALHAVGPNSLRMVVACDPQYGQGQAAQGAAAVRVRLRRHPAAHARRRRDPVRLELAARFRRRSSQSSTPENRPYGAAHPASRPRERVHDVLLDDLHRRAPGVGRRDRHRYMPIGIDPDVTHDSELDDTQHGDFGVWNALECRPYGCEVVGRGSPFRSRIRALKDLHLAQA